MQAATPRWTISAWKSETTKTQKERQKLAAPLLCEPMTEEVEEIKAKVTFEWQRLKSKTLDESRGLRAAMTQEVLGSEEVKDAGRRVCETNLLALAWVLGYFRIDPKVHSEALNFFLVKDRAIPLEEQSERPGVKRRGTLLYPRGTYKSTLNITDTVQWVINWPLNVRVLILCAVKQLAIDFVGEVADHFIPSGDPTLFQALYPELCIRAQDKVDGKFSPPMRQKDPPLKEAAVEAASDNSSRSGWHYDVYKPDDIVTNRNGKTTAAQKKVTANYKMNRKQLMPYGIEDKMGTRYGPYDVYGDELETTTPGSLRFVVKPAMKLKSGERLGANGFPAEREVELMFPTLLTYAFLKTEYDSDYPSFMTQYMNDAYGDRDVVFTYEQFMEVVQSQDEMPLAGVVIIHWRLPAPSIGFLTAAAAAGVIDAGRLNVIDVVHGTYKPSALAKKVVTMARDHGTHRISIEQTPGSQNYEAAILNYALTSGWPVSILWKESDEDSDSRDTRIRSLEPMMASKRIMLAEEIGIMRKVTEQFTAYGITDDSSIPDAIAQLASSLPNIVTQGREEEDDDLSLDMMRQRDTYNRVHGLGHYAPVEPEPQAEPERPAAVTPRTTYHDEIPGLMT